MEKLGAGEAEEIYSMRQSLKLFFLQKGHQKALEVGGTANVSTIRIQKKKKITSMSLETPNRSRKPAAAELREARMRYSFVQSGAVN